MKDPKGTSSQIVLRTLDNHERKKTGQSELQPVAAVVTIFAPVKPKKLRDIYCLRCAGLYIPP
ncbi:hypothetical protein DPMN_003163, partial [Dreissena polymorpha]